MRDAVSVRTTLDLDDDVLNAVKELAGAKGSTAGRVLSELARRGLASGDAPPPRMRNGVPLLRRHPAGSPPLTMKRVNERRDDA
jgi:hypothetical protein